jgi:16S rRNA pseudouridine516 synthase
MRIDKLLCDLNICTRSEAKSFIKKGLVNVNGETVKDPGAHVDPDSDTVFYKGEKLKYIKNVYFMLNKPAGIVSAVTDDKDKTVIDLFRSENRKGLVPVGRLDKDTHGLIIITDDGDLCHHLTSPGHHVPKTYFVGLKDPITDDSLLKLEAGVELKGDGITKPAKTLKLNEKEILLTINEGMYHQVKRMAAAVGNKVIYLKRIGIGDIKLDESLKEGEYRQLTKEELLLLKK